MTSLTRGGRSLTAHTTPAVDTTTKPGTLSSPNALSKSSAFTSKDTKSSTLLGLPATPQPRTPYPWLWRCHGCGAIYKLGTTRRCLECSHVFCTSPNDPSRAEPEFRMVGNVRIYRSRPAAPARRARKSNTACRAEFDYLGWKEHGNWRRETINDRVIQEAEMAVADAILRRGSLSAGGSAMPKSPEPLSPKSNSLKSIKDRVVQALQSGGSGGGSTLSHKPTTKDAETTESVAGALSTQQISRIMAEVESPVKLRKKHQQVSEELRQKLFHKREHNCWVHCDYPSECRHTLYAAVLAGDLPEKVLYVKKRNSIVVAEDENTIKFDPRTGYPLWIIDDGGKDTPRDDDKINPSSSFDESDDSSESYTEGDTTTAIASPKRRRSCIESAEIPVLMDIDSDQLPTPSIAVAQLEEKALQGYEPMELDHNTAAQPTQIPRGTHAHLPRLNTTATATSSPGDLSPIKLTPEGSTEHESWGPTTPRDPDMDVDMEAICEDFNEDQHMTNNHAQRDSWSLDGNGQIESIDGMSELTQWAHSSQHENRSQLKVDKLTGLESLESLNKDNNGKWKRAKQKL